MENKINIVELLKDCPKGMELDCTMYDNCTFGCIVDSNCYPIQIQTPEGNMRLSEYGCMSLSTHSKCTIFPKGKTTWEGFVPPCKFKDGDIVVTKTSHNFIFYSIFQGIENREVLTYVDYYLDGNRLINVSPTLCYTYEIVEQRFATEEEKQKLFDAIKAKGYKWNTESKTLEKLIESNEDVDDKIVMSDIYFDNEYYADEVELHLDNYEIEIRDGKTYAIFKNQKTETLNPKFKVGDRIKEKQSNIIGEIIDVQKNKYNVRIDDKGLYLYFREQDNWELVPNKFDITTLVPLESKVLVRNVGAWLPAFWGYYAKEYTYPFVVDGGNTFAQCIPYEGNEHLLGTTNDCDNFYKNW